MRLPKALALAITTAAIGTTVAATPAFAGSIAANWQMDETSGSTMVDSSGNGNNGTLKNVQVGLAGPSGGSDRAYGFNGKNSTVVVPDQPAPIGTADVSMTAKVRFGQVPSTAVGDYDLIRGTKGSLYRMEIVARSRRTKGLASCRFAGSSGKFVLTAGPNLADNRWHTITCAKTSKAVQVVVDGTTYSKAITIGSIKNNGPLWIGSKFAAGDWYDGLLDDVSISIG